MSYISTRNVKGKKYYYLEESFKFKNKLVKESVYFGSMYPSNDEIFLGEEVLRRTCLARNHNVIVLPLTEFIRNRTAQILENAKNNYLSELNKLNEEEIKKLRTNKFEKLISLFEKLSPMQLSKEKIKDLTEYYSENLLKNELLNEVKIKKIYSLLLKNNETKNETIDFSQLHLLLTWQKEKNDLIHQVEFAAKFCSKFYSLKLFKEHNLLLTIILMNYILEQKNFPFILLSDRKVKIFDKALTDGEKENYKSITKFLIKETIKQSKIKK